MLPITSHSRSRQPRRSRRKARLTAPILVLLLALFSIAFIGFQSWAALFQTENSTLALEQTRSGGAGATKGPANDTARTICGPASSSQADSFLRCRAQKDAHMTPASAPHVLCDAGCLVLDPARMQPASFPKHRPHYLTSAGRTYHRYTPGAFASACEWPEVPRNLSAFPRDHLRDIMESFQASPAGLQVDRKEETPALLVTREIEEHANVFHTMTDLLNVYITLRVLRWDVHAPRQIVLLDSHPHGPLDALWPAVAAGGGARYLNGSAEALSPGGQPLVRRVEGLGPGAFELRRAAFVPPGYTSLLFAHLYENASCPFPTPLFKGFRSFVLEPLGLMEHQPSQYQGPLKVVLVSRKPAARKLVRSIAKEVDLLEMLRRMPNVEARLLDLATLTISEQLYLITHTDLLIGMHGAALAWTLLMPEHAGVLELWPQSEGVWRCYEHTSLWSGLLYRRWAAPSPGPSDDVTVVDGPAVRAVVSRMIPQVTRRRFALKKHHGFHQEA
ncbi:hypothetical protein WJX84_010568 [Apatococcus fuscideae]|uniref:Glycosyltransferase 61 catalytic domain-containing protein n=1 Tax=Apatococcus fuscideae TaxID=2026836 RepID=A0AAW1SKH4_9CHLO